jgi:hypothetical protein
VRGGKRKIFFTVTDSGIEALEAALEGHQRLWNGVTRDALKKGYAR